MLQNHHTGRDGGGSIRWFGKDLRLKGRLAGKNGKGGHGMSDLSCLRVLYVEDDEGTREAFARFLEQRMGRLFLAASGEEGLHKFRDCRPNLLITDLIMPGISGLDMIGEIRKMDKDCRILITSSISELATVLEAVDLGIDHYIIKPIDTEELVTKIEGIARIIRSREGRDRSIDLAGVKNSGIVEDVILRGFLKLLKTYSGKGPQDVKVLLFENKVEITVFDAATTMEKIIVSNRKNISMAEQFRRLFYEELSQRLEETVEQATGYRAKMTSLRVDGTKRVDRIILTVVENI